MDKGKLESDIGEIIATRKLPQLLNLANESNEKEGLRIALEMKPGTRSEPDHGVPLQAHGAAGELRLQHDLPGASVRRGRQGTDAAGTAWPARRSCATSSISASRRCAAASSIELEQLRRRIHILEGFRIIFNALDKAIKIIRESDGKADAAEQLISAFKLDEEQADAILDAQLYKIAQLEIKKILDELKEKNGAGGEDRGASCARRRSSGASSRTN